MSLESVVPYIEKNVLVVSDSGEEYKGAFLSVESGIETDSGDDEMDIYTDKGFFWGIPLSCVISIREI